MWKLMCKGVVVHQSQVLVRLNFRVMNGGLMCLPHFLSHECLLNPFSTSIKIDQTIVLQVHEHCIASLCRDQ